MFTNRRTRHLAQKTSVGNRPFRPRLLRLEDRTTPVKLTVTSTADTGLGTLRQAILDANATPAADTIVFSGAAKGGLISLESGGGFDYGISALSVTSDITIRGSGERILRGGSQRRLFFVASSGTLTISNLELRDGFAVGGKGGASLGNDGGGGGGGAGMGGAIFNRGTLTITNCLFTQNFARGGDGGDGADLVGTDSGGGGGGGGMGGEGGITADTNADGGSGGGGFVGNGASGSIVAGGGGGGSSSSATGQTGGSLDGGNGGDLGANGTAGGFGGGGGGGGDEGSGGAGGVGGGGGGGGENDDATPNGGGPGGWGGGGGGGGEDGSGANGGFGGGGGGASKLDAAPQFGGSGGWPAGNGGSASSGRGSGGGGGGAGLGGAIFNHSGTVTIWNSTFSNNRAQGGLGGTGYGTASNGTVGSGLGGSIFTANGSLTIRNCTLTSATADFGRGVFAMNAGGPTMVHIDNSILGQADNSRTDFGYYLIGGVPISSGQGNLIRGNSGFNGSIVSTADPLLGPLTDNGGYTKSHALLSGSPALDAGVNAAVPVGATSDQRGFPYSRIVDGDVSGISTVDIGAFEFQTNVTVEPILGAASLLFTDLRGLANNLTIRRNGDNVIFNDPSTILTTTVGTVSDAGHTVSMPRTLFPAGRIQINTSDGADTITLDWRNGHVEPSGAGSIFINSGNGTDKLNLVGDTTSYIRIITGLQTPQPTASSIRRVPSAGTARQHFLTNLENLEVSAMGTLDFLTRNGDDVVNYESVGAGRGKISGTSGFVAGSNRQPFIPVTWTNTPTLYLYTSNGDSASTNNVATIQPNAFKAAGMKSFIYSGGAGVDILDVKSVSDFVLPVANGQILFNGNTGTKDRLIVSGDTNFTLNNFRLTPASGGFVRPVNVEKAVIIGGASANTINASGFSGSVVLDGKGGNDILIASAGRSILVGGTLTFEADTVDMARVGDEWLRTLAYATRVAHLKSGGGLNDPVLINTLTAPNDGSADTLRGNGGLDWFWAFVPNDVLLDKLAEELLR